MNKRYNILVIGCGHMGEEHLKDIYYREEICIAAVVDQNEDRAKYFARKFGAESYGTDYRIFLDESKIDIAIIATYAASHLKIFGIALKRTSMCFVKNLLRQCCRMRKHSLI